MNRGAVAERLCDDAFAMARDEFDSIIGMLRGPDAQELPHSALESLLANRGRELLRQLLQGHLDERGPGEAAGPVRDAAGNERTEARLHERSLSSVVGDVQVRRLGYGAEGESSLHPLDADLNLPKEQYSHGLRRLVAQEAAKGSFDEVQATVTAQTGITVPKRQVEQLAARAAVDFDAFYKEREGTLPAAANSVLVITADGKGVAMGRESLRAPTRQAAEQSGGHRLDKRLTSGEKRHRKRMATVAAVYTIAPFPRTPDEVMKFLAPRNQTDAVKRPRPEAKRVWASLEKDVGDVLEDAFAEAPRRDPQQAKTWVALVDGNAPQIQHLERIARGKKIELTIVLDLIHVTEYLWSASLAFHEETDRRREFWVEDRLLRILSGESSQVAGGMRRSATVRTLSVDARKAVDRCCDYLIKHRRFLHYDQYLAKGLPIATGVIEGACRHLVKDRMDLTGARWSVQGAEAVLRLRALRSSGDFDAYWQYHETREYQRIHAARYADGKVTPLRGRFPRRVK